MMLFGASMASTRKLFIAYHTRVQESSPRPRQERQAEITGMTKEETSYY